MDSFWMTMLLALFSVNKNNNYDYINYVGKYTKYFKYGSDE